MHLVLQYVVIYGKLCTVLVGEIRSTKGINSFFCSFYELMFQNSALAAPNKMRNLSWVGEGLRSAIAKLEIMIKQEVILMCSWT